MPDGSAIHNAMASGVADVIQMLNEEDGVVSWFQAAVLADNNLISLFYFFGDK